MTTSDKPTAGPPAVPALPSGARQHPEWDSNDPQAGRKALAHADAILAKHDSRAASAASPAVSAEERAERWMRENLGPLYPSETWLHTLAEAIRSAESAAYARGLADARRAACDYPDLCLQGCAVECGPCRRIGALAGAPPAAPDRIKELEGALRALFGFVESGDLVRNAARDAEPGWAPRAMSLVMALKRAQELVGASGALAGAEELTTQETNQQRAGETPAPQSEKE